MVFVIIGIIAAIIAIVAIAVAGSNNVNYTYTGTVFEPAESEQRRAGRYGERVATDLIKRALREDDRLFTNVRIEYDGKFAELDNVIVSSYGVFIIEVKNYKGRLYGNEDDYEWEKYKDDGYGNTFEKKVKNPIKQVKRQIYLLAKYLEYYGPRVWVEGYALLIHGNSPVESRNMLSNSDDIDRAIHTPGKCRLTKQQVESIIRIIQ